MRLRQVTEFHHSVPEARTRDAAMGNGYQGIRQLIARPHRIHERIHECLYAGNLVIRQNPALEQVGDNCQHTARHSYDKPCFQNEFERHTRIDEYPDDDGCHDHPCTEVGEQYKARTGTDERQRVNVVLNLHFGK